MIHTTICLLIIMLLSIAGVQAASNESGQKSLTPRSSDAHVREIAENEKKITLLLQTSKTFELLASQPHPKGLTREQIKEAQKYDRWLRQKSSELKRFAKKWQSATGRLNPASQQMHEMSRSFSLQYLAIQTKIQQENREFTLLSNIMKQRHKAAKNAVNNLR